MQAAFDHDENRGSGPDLQGLEEIVLWDPANWVDLILRTSEPARLRIAGDEAMIHRYRCWRKSNTLYIKLGGNFIDRIKDALTTSLTRKQVKVELSVDSLARIKATGMVEVDLAAWKGTEPEMHLFGPTALWGGQFPVMKRQLPPDLECEKRTRLSEKD